MLSSNKPLGTQYIEVQARIEKAQAELEKIKTKMGEVDQTASTSTGNVKKSFSSMTENVQTNISRQVGAITGLIGSFTAVVSVAKTFYDIGGKVGEMLFANEERTKRYTKAVGDLDRALDFNSGQIELYSETIARAEKELGFRNLTADSIAESEALKVEAAQYDAKIELLEARIETIKDFRDSYDSARPAVPFSVAESEPKDLQRELEILIAARDMRINESRKAISRLDRARRELSELDAQRARQAQSDAIANAANTIGSQVIDPIEAKADDLTRKYEALRDLVGDAELGIDAKEEDLLEAVRALSKLGLAEFPKSIKDAERINNQLVDSLLDDFTLRDDLKDLQKSIGDSITKLREDNKDLPEKIERAIDSSLNRFLERAGLLQINQTLGAINANQDRLADEFSRLQ